jgi:hypothetical protein
MVCEGVIMDKYYQIPNMVISKEDLKRLFHKRNDQHIEYPVIDKLTDTEMNNIARRMTNIFMDNYWLALKNAYYDSVDEIEDGDL